MISMPTSKILLAVLRGAKSGLDRACRVIPVAYVTIAVLLALGREDELRMHLRACFNNGVTKDDLKELILHCSLYAGLPAANAAMHMAEEVFCRFGYCPAKAQRTAGLAKNK